jgi:mannan endo-1,4-beta-mannosidase
MKAVIFFSNNWEWSGGFLQYLRWNGKISDSLFRAPMELEYHAGCDQSGFIFVRLAKKIILKQVALVLNRTNSISGRAYKEDPVIMAWELANEPRPMRHEANEAYRQWIASTAAYIKANDQNHLVTLGHEGEIGTQNMDLYEAIHRDSLIDYLTIHIWPRNWGWYKRDALGEALPEIIQKSKAYIDKHISLAAKAKKATGD